MTRARRQSRFAWARAAGASAAVVATVLAASSSAASDATPAARAGVLTRVLSYERTLEDRAGRTIVLAVVYEPGDRASEASADAWLGAFKAMDNVRIKGLPFSAIKVPAREPAMTEAIEREGVDVLFVPDATDRDLGAVRAVARQRKVLSAGANEAYASSEISLAVVPDGDKSKLVVNLTANAAEGIKFSSKVLQLATVIR